MAEGRSAATTQPSVGETFRYLLAKRSFRHLAFGGALTAFVGYGFVNWMPSFLIRSHGMSTAEIGKWLGLIIGVRRRRRHLVGRISRRSVGSPRRALVPLARHQSR